MEEIGVCNHQNGITKILSTVPSCPMRPKYPHSPVLLDLDLLHYSYGLFKRSIKKASSIVVREFYWNHRKSFYWPYVCGKTVFTRLLIGRLGFVIHVLFHIHQESMEDKTLQSFNKSRSAQPTPVELALIAEMENLPKKKRKRKHKRKKSKRADESITKKVGALKHLPYLERTEF